MKVPFWPNPSYYQNIDELVIFIFQKYQVFLDRITNAVHSLKTITNFSEAETYVNYCLEKTKENVFFRRIFFNSLCSILHGLNFVSTFLFLNSRLTESIVQRCCRYEISVPYCINKVQPCKLKSRNCKFHNHSQIEANSMILKLLMLFLYCRPKTYYCLIS